MKKKQSFSWILIFVLSVLFPIIVLLITDQNSLLQKMFLSLSLFFVVGLILILLFPTTNKEFVGLLQQKFIYVLVIMGLLLIPLSNWFFIEVFSISWAEILGSYVLWYILPVCILSFPTLHPKLKPFGPLFHIGGVIFLAIGFDNRATSFLMSGFVDMEYTFNALWISVLILTIISIQFDDYPAFFNWEITLKKVLFPLAIICSVGIAILPIGLLSGFITWAPTWDGLGTVLITFLGIWFTIALPEEVIARGVIQHQLLKMTRDNIKKYKRLLSAIMILLSSFIFGLSHWNNTSAEFVWIYIGLATIAGIGFGWCWEKHGLLSSMLMHTLIDFIWVIFFKS